MKKKSKYILFILILLIITIAGICALYIKNNEKDKKNEKDYGDLVEVTYSCSGDMLGNTHSIKLDIKKRTVTLSDAEMHSDPIIKTIYKVDRNKINIIKDLIDRYKVASYDDLEIDDTLFVYDACSPSLKLEYITGPKNYNREYYNISYYYNLPDISRLVINTVRDDLYDLLIDENIISATVVEAD
ncbi:MAG: hypothetical protein J5634_00690 [Bacilli bacterium]|nr:hypothetical protein [Bacilli bacterium]